MSRQVKLRDIRALLEVGQFDLAIQATQKIESAKFRSWAFREIAVAMAIAGQLDSAFQAAQKIEDSWIRSSVFKEIAEALVEAGQFDLIIQVAQTKILKTHGFVRWRLWKSLKH
jgi:serine protease Do